MNYYSEIKDIFINNEVTKRVKDYSKNKSDLDSYYNVGKLLVEAQGGEARAKYGDGLIKEYSKRLTSELGKKYNSTLLKNTRLFYLIMKKSPTMSDQLTWSHYVELFKFNNINEFNYYVKISENQNLSVRQLREKIKSKEYERLDEETKNKLVNKLDTNVTDFIKNPIIINNKYNIKNIKENVLKKLILEDIDNFLKELGEGFCYIGCEYKIKIGNSYNYIDLLLFNYIYNCFVVVELKVTELKKEHIGQIQVYMNYIDSNIKTINQNKTIGIIICKKNNKYIIEYCSNKRILSREYSFL